MIVKGATPVLITFLVMGHDFWLSTRGKGAPEAEREVQARRRRTECTDKNRTIDGDPRPGQGRTPAMQRRRATDDASAWLGVHVGRLG